MPNLIYKIIKTPVGHLTIVVNDQFLVAILWENEKANRVRLTPMVENKKNPLIVETEKQLMEYFEQKRKIFDLPIQMFGTSFQQEVWQFLRQIPYGSTSSYKDIAVQMKNPLAVRAVGSANGRNPISIIVPCHRVIASNGSLGGFAGGLHHKKILLDLENAQTK